MLQKMNFEPGTFILVPNKHLLKKMSMKAQITWLALCAHADSDGVCWPSFNAMSKLTNIGERTLKRGVEELIELKLVEKKQRKKEDGSYSSNYYTLYLHPPCAE